MFLTVKEAAELSGKSPTTIYRLCNKRRNSTFIRKEDNKFLIDRDFLLATYPQHEKQISHEIEYGKLEITEPVFLEIEPKLKEVYTVTEIAVENSKVINEVVSTPEIKVQEVIEEKEIPLYEEQKEPETVVRANEIIDKELADSSCDFSPIAEDKESLTSQSDEVLVNPLAIDEQLPFYKKQDFWESFIGISIITILLFFLLFLFYLSSQ